LEIYKTSGYSVSKRTVLGQAKEVKRAMAKFKVFLGTEPLDTSTGLEKAVIEELKAISNYQNPPTTDLYFYTDNEEEAETIAAEAKKIYALIGWDSDSVIVEPV
jgi:hypothetical protein